MAGWRKKLVDVVPLQLLTHAHEIAIALVLACLAAPAALSVLPGQDQVGKLGPTLVVWGWVSLLSAGLTLRGVFRNRPRMEWAGQLLSGYTLTFCAAALILSDAATFPTAVTFTILGLVGWWRAFKITSTALVQLRITEAARTAHRRAAEQRGR